MLVLAPVMCILSGIGVSQVLTTYMKNLDVSRPDKKSKKQQDATYPIKNEVGRNRKATRWHQRSLQCGFCLICRIINFWTLKHTTEELLTRFVYTGSSNVNF